jgi:hypothetical protein
MPSLTHVAPQADPYYWRGAGHSNDLIQDMVTILVKAFVTILLHEHYDPCHFLLMRWLDPWLIYETP